MVLYSGNATNLTQHLKRHHHHEYDILIIENSESGQSKEKQSKIDEFVANTSGKMATYPINCEKVKKFHKNLTIMIAKDLQPLSMVQDIGFKNLILGIDCKLPLPSRGAIKKYYKFILGRKNKNSIDFSKYAS